MIPNREYNPSCFMCRKIAGKEPAGILQASLCFHHLQERCLELEERERELIRINKELSAAFDRGVERERVLVGELECCREMYKRDC
jgi:hypothetical protein